MTLPLGPHFQRSTPNGLLWNESAPIVKSIDDVSLLEDVPSAIKIYRHYDQFESSTDPDGTVGKLLASLKGYTNPFLYLQIWTGAHPTLEVLTRAVQLVHAAGYKTIGSSWYTGDYGLNDWLDAEVAGVDAFGPQCYWGNQGFTLNHALRYRVYKKPGQLVLVPECGRDAVEGGKPGWLAEGISPTQYAGELAAYANLLAQDGAMGTAFVVGNYPPFQNYELETVIPTLLPLLGGTVPDPIPTPKGASLLFLPDISSNNGRVPISAVAKVADAIWIKATEGLSYVNPFFGDQWQEAGDLGLPRGAYHLCRPSEASGADEASRFLEVAAKEARSGDFFALDSEDTNVAPDADLVAHHLDFFHHADAGWGAKGIFYSGHWYTEPHNLETSDELATHGLWLEDMAHPTQPVIIPKWTFWAFLQYGQGYLPGVVGLVDFNAFQGSLSQLRKYGKP